MSTRSSHQLKVMVHVLYARDGKAPVHLRTLQPSTVTLTLIPCLLIAASFRAPNAEETMHEQAT